MVLVTGSASADHAKGILRRLPVTGVLLLLGLFAVTGSPPFGLFLSEFTILNAAIAQGHPWIALAVVVLLAIIFVGMASVMLEVRLCARRACRLRSPARACCWWADPCLLLAAVLVLGLYVPPPLHRLLAAAAQGLGVPAP